MVVEDAIGEEAVGYVCTGLYGAGECYVLVGCSGTSGGTVEHYCNMDWLTKYYGSQVFLE